MESISTVGAELDKQELLGLLIRVSAKGKRLSAESIYKQAIESLI